MARGKASPDGAVRVAANGYHYTKVKDRGWVLTHWLTAEAKILGRLMTDGETARFKEPKYKKDPYDPKGIIIIKKRTTSLRRRAAVLEARIEQDTNELAEIRSQLGVS